MKFSESRAQEYIKQYSLQPGTLNVWRTRGQIPKKYANGTAKVASRSPEDQARARRILEVLRSGLLNVAALCRLAGIEEYYVVRDAIKSGSILSKTDSISLQRAINILVKHAGKAVRILEAGEEVKQDPEALINLMHRKELSWLNILEQNRQFYNRLSAWHNGRTAFPEKDANELRIYLSRLVEKIRI